MTYGFIGCGNMGGALARALSQSTKDIKLSNRTFEKAQTLACELDVIASEVAEVVQTCDYIFLGVKPQNMFAMLAPYAQTLAQRKPILVTMAAGITTSQIEDAIAPGTPVIRIMPNTPVSVGKGVVLYCANEWVSNEALAQFVRDMAPCGMLDELPEELIDAGCALSGCGPAFVYQFIDALASGGEACGLSREKALLYAQATLIGASELSLASPLEPEELKRAVCSPGGATLQGVHVLDEANFSQTTSEAVVAAFKRSQELSTCAK